MVLFAVLGIALVVLVTRGFTTFMRLASGGVVGVHVTHQELNRLDGYVENTATHTLTDLVVTARYRYPVYQSANVKLEDREADCKVWQQRPPTVTPPGEKFAFRLTGIAMGEGRLTPEGLLWVKVSTRDPGGQPLELRTRFDMDVPKP
jgi:hypothetical protein